jgi:DUF971 family protein
VSVDPPHPVDARLGPEGLLLLTWSDGVVQEYAPDHLRAHCPCAHCAPTLPAEPPKPREIHAGVRITDLEEVGRYALRLRFSDGHDLGLYSHARLRELGAAPGQAPRPAITPSFEV